MKTLKDTIKDVLHKYNAPATHAGQPPIIDWTTYLTKEGENFLVDELVNEIKKHYEEINIFKTDSWKELNRAIKKSFIDEYDTKELKLKFMRKHNDRSYLQLYIEGIDNCFDKENDWHWDIFLNEDGTWNLN